MMKQLKGLKSKKNRQNRNILNLSRTLNFEERDQVIAFMKKLRKDR